MRRLRIAVAGLFILSLVSIWSPSARVTSMTPDLPPEDTLSSSVLQQAKDSMRVAAVMNAEMVVKRFFTFDFTKISLRVFCRKTAYFADGAAWRLQNSAQKVHNNSTALIKRKLL